MGDPIELAERVAAIARVHGVQSALIGAAAMAIHRYVRGTKDLDLATLVDPFEVLEPVERALAREGLHTRLRLPDDDDSLGGVLRVWEEEDEDGDPIDYVEIVNFLNPLRPRVTPAGEAIRTAEPLEHTGLRCVRLPLLVAMKLDAGGRGDLADVVALLKQNPTADREEIRAVCKRYQLDVIDTLIAEADAV